VQLVLYGVAYLPTGFEAHQVLALNVAGLIVVICAEISDAKQAKIVNNICKIINIQEPVLMKSAFNCSNKSHQT
jgi:hypothetical protein